MELTLSRCLADRMFKLSGLHPCEPLDTIIIELIEGAKEGHLCSFIDPCLELPKAICSEGCNENPFPKTPLVRQSNRLYLQKNWAIETLIFHKIQQMLSRPVQEQDLDLFKTEIGSLSLQEGQVKALYMGFEKSFAIFTGGPGTGKSYTAGCFIRLLGSQKKSGYRVMITAPTGKAAAHLESALRAQGQLPDYLRCESMTLHRLLKLQPGTQKFFSDRQIDADLVVVDEASMLDPPLLLHLLNATGPNTRLLLLGDSHQLPPVEGGSLFPEIAMRFGQKLDRSLRMGEGSLFNLSQAILAGNVSEIAYEEIDWKQIIDRVCAVLPNPIYVSEPDPRQCLEDQKRFRILCALRQGPLGVDALNRELIARFKDRQGWFAIPILIVENNPKLQLYNGSTGVLIRSKAYFFFGDELRMIPEGSLPRYEAAFFLSVHKSQGSEYDEVVAIFPPSSERFGREALYTAVTRAKKQVRIWIDEATLSVAIQSTGIKRSGLVARL